MARGELEVPGHWAGEVARGSSGSQPWAPPDRAPSPVRARRSGLPGKAKGLWQKFPVPTSKEGWEGAEPRRHQPLSQTAPTAARRRVTRGGIAMGSWKTCLRIAAPGARRGFLPQRDLLALRWC